MHTTVIGPHRASARGHGKPDHLARLLAQRDRLAAELAEAQAHELAGADDTARLLDATEDAIGRACSPAHRGRLLTGWVEKDAAREHTSRDPRPETCPTCAQ